jgi:hypothetical protein
MFRSVASFLIALSLVVSFLIPAAAIVKAGNIAVPQNGVVTISLGNPIKIAVQTFGGWPTLQDHFDAVQMALDDYGAIKRFSLLRANFIDDCNTPSGETAANSIVADLQQL